MVDKINLNQTLPLLSSAERVKKVDRRRRNDRQPPFNDALKEKKKKKKKKKDSEKVDISAAAPIEESLGLQSAAGENTVGPDKKPMKGRQKKIIDIRV
jgi:hypothetical protein